MYRLSSRPTQLFMPSNGSGFNNFHGQYSVHISFHYSFCPRTSCIWVGINWLVIYFIEIESVLHGSDWTKVSTIPTLRPGEHVNKIAAIRRILVLYLQFLCHIVCRTLLQTLQCVVPMSLVIAALSCHIVSNDNRMVGFSLVPIICTPQVWVQARQTIVTCLNDAFKSGYRNEDCYNFW